MVALILAAGYATRLYPLTKDTSKALLPIGGKPILDYIVDEILEIPEITKIVIISNNPFYNDFCQWSKMRNLEDIITVIDDGSTSLENRLGAVGDIVYALDKENIDDDLLIIAGDTFFNYKLLDAYKYFVDTGKNCVVVKETDDIELCKRCGICTIDSNNRIIHFEEKPPVPQSNMLVYATYFFKSEVISMFKQYVKEGNLIDAPGFFLSWLIHKVDVLAYKMKGECYDIGTLETYDSICKMYENS